MADIILTAFNARYAHCSFSARYLLANLGALQKQAELLEFDLTVQPRIAVEKILARNPRIVSIGCYIWNIDLATQVAALLKHLRPDIVLVLGGPEISYETEQQEIFQYADYVICGEGEVEFPKLCRRIFTTEATEEDGGTSSANSVSSSAERNEDNLHEQIVSVGDVSPSGKMIRAEPVDVEQIKLPYDLYTDEDIAHRAIYVEASRGCPFRCEYCMSSLDPCVRYFPKERFFDAMQRLLNRCARTFKFVDRSFNIDIAFALEILAFFRERHAPGMMLHFEIIPDRLPDELMDAVKECPPGMLQFEIGIQTFNEAVAHRIQRPLDIDQIEANLRRLSEESGVHIHTDLIAGLPGEDMESFEAGFNRLLALHPQEIQLGILKRLRGAPIDRHTREWNMVYSPHAPYEILQTNLIPFEQMQRVQRFARYWNLTVNNGQFIRTAPLIWKPVPPASSGLPATTGFHPHQVIHRTKRKNLPHWIQDGCTYFVTFRLADSIPQSHIQEYEELRQKWKEQHHPPFSEREWNRFNELFSDRVNEWLDEGAGSCCLRDPALSDIVADALMYFDGERYELDEWVVMPNHVHLLVRPLTGYELPDILHSWKSFSANAINHKLGKNGRLWKKEYYDHIVRDLDELLRIRKYIRNNPQKAGIHVYRSSSLLEAGDTPVPPASYGHPSPFAAFMQWSDWLYAQTNTTGNLHMVRLARLLMQYLAEEKGIQEKTIAEALWIDYQRGNRPDVPGFLKKFGFEKKDTDGAGEDPSLLAQSPAIQMPRQSRHRGKL